MIEWPFYQVAIEADEGYEGLFTIASPAIGSAMIDALVIANGETSQDIRMTDIVAVHQVGTIFISSTVMEEASKG